ncbi:acyltransferase family protein [Polaribacter sp. Q13]|uniref:acyltransferase family protein n=1 Tax=Polaribacter sp. Q13 TaxID=2806551 RepID=UPI00193B8A71|nr:acyltransferase family protein [Polaribacter sp. Q13]QVY65844.1 acyltransferase family protein [Polaribacter sp. Q13]
MKYSWIDIVKGIGIILVVLGHITGGYSQNLIFLVHMPLFFFISGYLFKSQCIKDYFLKKTISLLLPYFTFLVILYPFEYPYSVDTNIFKYILKPIYGGQLLNNGLIAFWFITCLFLTQQVFNLLVHKINSKKLLALIVFLFYITSYINSEIYSVFKLPWNANVVLAAIPFFYTGYLFKLKKYSINLIVILVLNIISAYIIYYQTPIAYDMKTANYGIPIISFILSTASILFIIFIAKKLQHINFISKKLKYIGRKSMIIMFLHQPIYIFLKNNFNINIILTFTMIIGFSCLFYKIFEQNIICRVLFLGSKKDLDLLRNNSKNKLN